MSKVKDIHILGLIIFLMIIRIFVEGKWFSGVVIAGLLVSLFDIINKLYQSNFQLVGKNQKFKYGICFICLNLVFLLGCMLLLVNAIIEIKWINTPIFLDEVTLLTLLITLPQNIILEKINKIIRK